MTNITLHGELGRVYGKNHKLQVSTMGELIRAMNANNSGFRARVLSDFKKGINYCYVNPQDPRREYKRPEEFFNSAPPAELHIVPSICGAGVVAAFAISAAAFAGGAALTAAGFATLGGALTSLAVGLLIQGVMSLLFPVELPDQPSQEVETKIDQSSYIFSNLKNNAVQGFPVPLVYGELRIGSNIIGTQVLSEDLG